MENRRTIRIEDLIQRELNYLIAEESNFDPGVLITITKVKVSKDLQWAKVFVSIYPFYYHKKVFNYLIGSTPHFQHKINKLINIRHTPKIIFKSDMHFEEGDKMIKMIDSNAKDA